MKPWPFLLAVHDGEGAARPGAGRVRLGDQPPHEVGGVGADMRRVRDLDALVVSREGPAGLKMEEIACHDGLPSDHRQVVPLLATRRQSNIHLR